MSQNLQSNLKQSYLQKSRASSQLQNRREAIVVSGIVEGVEEIIWISKIVDGEFVLSMKQWGEESQLIDQENKESKQEKQLRNQRDIVQQNAVKEVINNQSPVEIQIEQSQLQNKSSENNKIELQEKQWISKIINGQYSVIIKKSNEQLLPNNYEKEDQKPVRKQNNEQKQHSKADIALDKESLKVKEQKNQQAQNNNQQVQEKKTQNQVKDQEIDEAKLQQKQEQQKDILQNIQQSEKKQQIKLPQEEEKQSEEQLSKQFVKSDQKQQETLQGKPNHLNQQNQLRVLEWKSYLKDNSFELVRFQNEKQIAQAVNKNYEIDNKKEYDSKNQIKQDLIEQVPKNIQNNNVQINEKQLIQISKKQDELVQQHQKSDRHQSQKIGESDNPSEFKYETLQKIQEPQFQLTKQQQIVEQNIPVNIHLQKQEQMKLEPQDQAQNKQLQQSMKQQKPQQIIVATEICQQNGQKNSQLQKLEEGKIQNNEEFVQSGKPEQANIIRIKTQSKKQKTVESQIQFFKPAQLQFQIKRQQTFQKSDKMLKSQSQIQNTDPSPVFNQEQQNQKEEQKSEKRMIQISEAGIEKSQKIKTMQKQNINDFYQKIKVQERQLDHIRQHSENKNIQQENPPIDQSEIEDVKSVSEKQQKQIEKETNKQPISQFKQPSSNLIVSGSNDVRESISSGKQRKFLDDGQSKVTQQKKSILNERKSPIPSISKEQAKSSTLVPKQQQKSKQKETNVVQVQTHHRQKLSLQNQIINFTIKAKSNDLQLSLEDVTYTAGPGTVDKSLEEKDELKSQIDLLKQTINQLTKNKPTRRSVRKESSGDIRSKKLVLKTNQKASPTEKYNKEKERQRQQSDYQAQSPTNGYQENELVMKIKRKEAEFQKFIKSTKLSRLQLHRSTKVNPKADIFAQNAHLTDSSGKLDLMLDLPEDYRLIQKKQSINTQQERYRQIILPKITTSIKQKVAQLPQPPTFEMKSKQLTILGKAAFKIFGIDIDEDEVLKINKYRNCVYFGVGDSHILWHYSGQFYVGDWKIKEDGQGCKQGYGIQYIPEKYIYEGEFFNGKRQGKGRMESFMNQIYEGGWKEGKRDGFGKLTDSFGKVIHGKWSNGKRTDEPGNQEQTEQNFKKEEFPNGDSYEGNYLNQKFQGQGKYIWKDGSFYIGHFSNGLRSGYGVWRSAAVGGDTYQGSYRDDKKWGRGKYTWSNGTVYIGNFEKDLKHGEGQLKFLDGRTINMNSFNGIPLNYHNKSFDRTPTQKRSLETHRDYDTPRRNQGSAIKWSLKKINENRDFIKSVNKNRKIQ